MISMPGISEYQLFFCSLFLNIVNNVWRDADDSRLLDKYAVGCNEAYNLFLFNFLEFAHDVMKLFGVSSMCLNPVEDSLLFSNLVYKLLT